MVSGRLEYSLCVTSLLLLSSVSCFFYALFFFFFFPSVLLYVGMCVCVCVCACTLRQSLSYVRLFAPSWTVAHQAPLSMGFSGQEY